MGLCCPSKGGGGSRVNGKGSYMLQGCRSLVGSNPVEVYCSCLTLLGGLHDRKSNIFVFLFGV